MAAATPADLTREEWREARGIKVNGHPKTFAEFSANDEDGPKPWERQFRETAKQFEAFAMYRDMGPDRSVRAVHEQIGKSHSLIHRWSKQRHWTTRAQAWDAETDRQRRAELEDLRTEALTRHARMGRTLLNVVAKRVLGFNDPAGLGSVTALDPNKLGANEVARLVEVGMKLERLALGLADGEGTKVEVNNVNVVAHDQRRQLALSIASDPEARRLAEGLLSRFGPGAQKARSQAELPERIPGAPSGANTGAHIEREHPRASSSDLGGEGGGEPPRDLPEAPDVDALTQSQDAAYASTQDGQDEGGDGSDPGGDVAPGPDALPGDEPVVAGLDRRSDGDGAGPAEPAPGPSGAEDEGPDGQAEPGSDPALD